MQSVQGRGEAGGRKLETEAKDEEVDQLCEVKQGRGIRSRAKDEVRH